MALSLRLLQRNMQARYGEGWYPPFWEAVRMEARNDVLAYGLYVHGHEHPIMTQFAMSWHAYLWNCHLEQHLQTLIVSPPEHAKTLFHRWYIEWWLGRQQEAHWQNENAAAPSALLVMNTADQANEHCMVIAATIEGNPRYQELFPSVEPDPKWGWTKDKLYLKRRNPRPDPSLMATGIFGPIQGKRFGMAVVDDPTDQEDAYSPTVLQKQIKRHQGVLDDRMLEDAPKRDIMTRWGKVDIPSVLQQSPRWACLTMPCLGYWQQHPEYNVLWDGHPPEELWPEVWPKERLEARRLEKEMAGDSTLWQLAWMCNPTLAEGELIRREWLKYYSPSALAEKLGEPIVARVA